MFGGCMEQLKLLEILAQMALPHTQITQFCEDELLSGDFKEALLTNNAEKLKKSISLVQYFANESHVVQT